MSELLKAMRTTHGGPSFVSRSTLKRVGQDALRQCTDAMSEAEYQRLCSWVCEHLNDPYASYLPDAQLNAMRERFHGRVGIGMSVRRRLQREPGDSWRRGWRRVAAVTAVEDQSPAAVAGVRVGDELLQVDSASAHDAELSTVTELLEGPEGSHVQLLVRRPGRGNSGASQGAVAAGMRPADDGEGSDGATTALRVRRQLLPQRSVTSRVTRLRMTTTRAGVEHEESRGEGTARVLRIAFFGASTASELRDELRQLRRGECAVLDLRDNDGGLLSAALASARMLLPPGAHLLSLQKVATRARHHAAAAAYAGSPSSPRPHAEAEADVGPPPDVPRMRTVRCYRRRWWHRSALPRPLRGADAPPLIVLVNRRSASAAEVLAAALAHSGRAVLVGKRTFGKGLSQALVYQRDGAGLLFTVYQLAAGARRGTEPLTRGVEPHVPWAWRGRRGIGLPGRRARGGDGGGGVPEEDAELAAAVGRALAHPARVRTHGSVPSI